MNIQRCWSWAIITNKDNADETRNALLNIVPHIHNEHTQCGDWWKWENNPAIQETFIKPKLKAELLKIFNQQANNASNLCANASSNTNE